MDSTPMDLRKMMELALACNASQVVIAHNHVSNIATPSGADILATENAYHLFEQVGVLLRDHLIFADDDFVSLRDSRYFEQFLR